MNEKKQPKTITNNDKGICNSNHTHTHTHRHTHTQTQSSYVTYHINRRSLSSSSIDSSKVRGSVHLLQLLQQHARGFYQCVSARVCVSMNE